MSQPPDNVDRELFKNVEKLRELRIAHRDLDEVISRLSLDFDGPAAAQAPQETQAHPQGPDRQARKRTDPGPQRLTGLFKAPESVFEQIEGDTRSRRGTRHLVSAWFLGRLLRNRADSTDAPPATNLRGSWPRAAIKHRPFIIARGADPDPRRPHSFGLEINSST